MKATITVRSPITESPRVEQVRGLFDLKPEKLNTRCWSVDLPLEDRPWNVGLITGASGAGKSTIARRLFLPGKSLWADDLPPWSNHLAVGDAFPEPMSVKEVTALLSPVGFSSPPSWLRPHPTLSTGERFRCDLARLLSHLGPRVIGVFDEYTSVVDRTVAQVGSAAVSKAVRARDIRFVAVTCHDDVEEWLQPDWVYLPAEGAFRWRSLRPRPRVELEVSRCTASSWKLFAPHHYLSGELVPSAWCWLAWWRGRPGCFSSWLPFVGKGPLARREHRTVVLPDYQGVGIGMAFSTLLASMWAGLGFVARSTTTHPAFAQARLRSPHWELVRQPSMMTAQERGKFKRMKRSGARLASGWRYVGPPMPRKDAQRLFGP
jgi:GNAT superfamily N-acetyltransferase